MCNEISLPYDTVMTQRKRHTILIKTSQLIQVADYLGESIDNLIYGESHLPSDYQDYLEWKEAFIHAPRSVKDAIGVLLEPYKKEKETIAAL